MGFWLTNGSPNLSQTTRPYNNQQKRRTCKIVDLAVPADHWLKLKENEKKSKYLDLARELKKLLNMQVTFIPITIYALVKLTEGLQNRLEGLEIRGRVEIIQTKIHYWERLELWEESWRIEETCCHSVFSKRLSADADIKNSQGLYNKNDDNA